MPARKRGPGRPPRAGSGTEHRLHVRLTGDEARRWQAAAERETLSLSEWLRAAAELAITRGSTR